MTSDTAGSRAHLPDGWPDRVAAWADDRLTRAGLTSDFQRDCTLAVLLALGWTGLLLVLFADPIEAESLQFEPFHMAAVVVVMAAQALVLCIRRVNPVVCVWMVALLQIAVVAVLPSGLTARGVTPFIAAYTCGALLPARRAAWVVTAAMVIESAGFAVASFVPGLTMASLVYADQPEVPAVSVVSQMTAQLLASALTYGGSAVVGAYIATRRQYVELVRVRAAEAIDSQRARADAAIGLERSRMARELHDIAAHHLSGMVVQTAVVERLIDRDPQAAKEAAAWIRAQGKETLHNLRLVVGALREPGDGRVDHDPDAIGDGGAPVPGLAVIDRLVRTAGELGTPVDLVEDGERRELPPIADVTFYRVAQEALSNAREHAPGAPARVLLRYRESEVALDVDNAAPRTRHHPRAAPSPGSHRGFGLAGMKERAQMIGAAFEAGPAPSGGWRVSLRLPLDGRDSPT
jgi:signal transduction histidine kinase